MDSEHILEEELPPPYSVHTSDRSSTSHGGSTQEGSLTSHLQHHLASLPNRIRMTQEAHSIRQSLDDASLLDLLLPEIDDFLSYLGSLHTTPSLAHLTLIPAAAVPPNAILSGMDEMRQRGEPCRVARVSFGLSNNDKKSKPAVNSNQSTADSQDWSVGRGFSDWGRFGDSPSATDPSQMQNMLWWRDEDMARRLARHLQPTTRNEPAPLETPVQAAVEERLPAQKEKKGWFWGKKANTSGSITSTFAARTVQADVETFPGKGNATQNTTKKIQEKAKSGARMLVTAEEVAFRSENELGLMESIRGWAIVIVVQVKA
ncbi:hypothetical protein F5Y09DRAFT_311141 [Xylaria sp. FL1042]|nr:hypothetical protein F5Y09DRAFT_311141 [Xylaria sp. FL1042]